MNSFLLLRGPLVSSLGSECDPTQPAKEAECRGRPLNRDHGG